jgi:putative ABC transport system permease protein
VALVLALVGVYGVTSHAVSQRAREIALRIALGAQGHQIGRLVSRQSLRCVLAGVGLGFLGPAITTRFMASLLFGVTTTDPSTFGGAAMALCVTALVEAWSAR